MFGSQHLYGLSAVEGVIYRSNAVVSIKNYASKAFFTAICMPAVNSAASVSASRTLSVQSFPDTVGRQLFLQPEDGLLQCPLAAEGRRLMSAISHKSLDIGGPIC